MFYKKLPMTGFELMTPGFTTTSTDWAILNVLVENFHSKVAQIFVQLKAI